MLAKKYLKKGHHPTSVYLECGFNDYSTFYRAYKARFGASPTKDIPKIKINWFFIYANIINAQKITKKSKFTYNNEFIFPYDNIANANQIL